MPQLSGYSIMCYSFSNGAKEDQINNMVRGTADS